MKTTRFVGALAALALLFAACGDDDDGGSGSGGESNAYSEAVADVLKEDEDNPFSDAEVDCLSVEFVDAVGGADALEEAGVTPEDIAESDEPSDVIDLPDDAPAKFAAAFTTCNIDLVDLFIATGGVDDEAADCLRDALDSSDLSDLFAGALAGDEVQPSGDIVGAFVDCGAA